MFKPTDDYILVRPLTRKQSDIIAVVSDEKSCRGEIVAVGPGKKNKAGNIMPMDAKVGDFVIFGDGTQTLDNCYPKYEENGVTYRLIQEADIVGILEPEEADIAA